MALTPLRLGRRLACDQWLELLDELNIGAFIVDLTHAIVAINYSAQALMGLHGPEVVGQDCREIFTGVPCMVNCLLAGGDGQDSEDPDLTIVDESQASHLITRLATPVYDSSDEVAGCLTILQDHSPITDLIDRVHYEERSLKHILDSIDIGIFTVNRGGLITFFNTAAEKISGYDRQQVLGQPCSAILAGENEFDVCRLEESEAASASEKRARQRGRIVDVDGVEVPIQAKYMALRNEKDVVVGGLATFHDLTLVHRLNQAISERYTYHDMIGKSPGMQKIFEMVQVVAQSDATVLIEGATGTGKDLLAKVIHNTGRRAGMPLVKINCAAIPENLIESEIFGYVKGAFTGAERDKPGRFSEAQGGTIFLDEIGDLPLALQAKLLRVLEDKEFYPLGSRHTRKVDVRIISATNRGLEKLVAQRLFREDLFYRLNVLRIELPPLKARRSDLPLLIRHIMRQLCAARGIQPPGMSKGAMEILLNFHYPGNVRELENILEHALIISQEHEILPQHLPDYLHRPVREAMPEKANAVNGYGTGHQKERQRIIAVLEKHGSNRSKTAKALGIDRSTLWRKMKRLGLLK